MTFGAFCGARELFCPALRFGRHFCICHLLDVFYQPTKFGVDVVACSCDTFGDAQAFGGAIQNFIQHFFREIFNGGVECGIVLFEKGSYCPENHRVLGFSEGNECALFDAE